MISQVKSLYDKYEVDMEMWDYRIEPYLSHAGMHNIMAEPIVSSHLSVNTLPPKYAPKQEGEQANS